MADGYSPVNNLALSVSSVSLVDGLHLCSFYQLSRREVYSMDRLPVVGYGHYSRPATSKTKKTEERQARGRV
jgi:hypothetical protein